MAAARYSRNVRLLSASAFLGALVAAAVSLVSSSPAFAQAPGKAAECVAATERGQTKRDEGQLVASRAEFVSCADDACPAIVRRECVQWLAEVDGRIPTLVVSASDSNGKDVVSAEVYLDGVKLPAAGAGRAFTLDPGPHLLRATGRKVDPLEERIVVREHERERVVKLVLHSQEPPPVRTPSGMVLVPRRRTISPVSWVLGGVAVLGGAGFGYFWISGMNKVSDLRGSCAPYCTTDQIDDARSPLTIARISGGVGIVAAIAAVTLYLLQPTTTLRPASAARVPSEWRLAF